MCMRISGDHLVTIAAIKEALCALSIDRNFVVSSLSMYYTVAISLLSHT